MSQTPIFLPSWDFSFHPQGHKIAAAAPAIRGNWVGKDEALLPVEAAPFQKISYKLHSMAFATPLAAREVGQHLIKPGFCAQKGESGYCQGNEQSQPFGHSLWDNRLSHLSHLLCIQDFWESPRMFPIYACSCPQGPALSRMGILPPLGAWPMPWC